RHGVHPGAGLQRLPRLRQRLPLRRHPHERAQPHRPEMHLLLRPPAARAPPRLRPGVSDPVDPVWPPSQNEGGGAGAAGNPAQTGTAQGTAVRRRRQGARRAELVLPAPGRAGSLRPALQPEGAEPRDAGLALLERVHRPARGAGCSLPLPHAATTGPVSGGRTAMNFFVVDPDWGFWIIAYFYLGGIAAGAYFLAILLEWFGSEED